MGNEGVILHYLVIDPGETSGVVEFTATGEVIAMHQLKKDELYTYLDKLHESPPQVIVYEEYKIFAHKAASHTNSKVPTLQIIGAIKYFGHRVKATVVEQPSQAKVIGYKYGGFNAPKNHALSHGPDALAHGWYYLVKHKILKVKPV